MLQSTWDFAKKLQKSFHCQKRCSFYGFFSPRIALCYAGTPRRFGSATDQGELLLWDCGNRMQYRLFLLTWLLTVFNRACIINTQSANANARNLLQLWHFAQQFSGIQYVSLSSSLKLLPRGRFSNANFPPVFLWVGHCQAIKADNHFARGLCIHTTRCH